ncbi:hypothetical protein QAD02_005862 [Eretmocerus hayati]|uniref:Uncharacterized protein n=1 Tax=Eretmocerus hayati TaxID=131215 RepID=A0ACC2NTP7_9HYME|nr:hypothetical protein QAD02_005862 [Eretmocerus hayati]
MRLRGQFLFAPSAADDSLIIPGTRDGGKAGNASGADVGCSLHFAPLARPMRRVILRDAHRHSARICRGDLRVQHDFWMGISEATSGGPVIPVPFAKTSLRELDFRSERAGRLRIV